MSTIENFSLKRTLNQPLLPLISFKTPQKDLSSSISQIFARIIKNPLFWGLIFTAACAATITFAAIFLSPLLALGISLLALSILGIMYYSQTPEQKKWLWSEFSLFLSSMLRLSPSRIFHHPWYTEITPEITLGAAPLKSRGHVEAIAENHGAVLSMIEDFEHEPHLLGTPATFRDWENREVRFLQLPTQDMTPVKLKDVEAGVEWMDQCILHGKRVYVHCLAGVGRSATIVACYLIRYHNLSAQEAIAYLRSKRWTVVTEDTPAIAAFERIHAPLRRAAC